MPGGGANHITTGGGAPALERRQKGQHRGVVAAPCGHTAHHKHTLRPRAHTHTHTQDDRNGKTWAGNKVNNFDRIRRQDQIGDRGRGIFKYPTKMLPCRWVLVSE
eukprot:1985562-Pyramimonas_sp.AAC.1